ncbi:relaxase/mobilization nuclease domain-containing protein [Pseudoflavonifractor phocaeensis]|uniref:relaxase/mobilization nuclease domain-containing protein n=1 Tax=Pseudoflavonifractor phocaeensis TaxID=1870988 RepID=UPI00210980D2|nr:relaxase/mobilization nuclease domain-containing protein [Pseudoflavonifractor phocaeensis]MCQ4866166.1 relaxase/mobilization nuclease domain-containing protein [Pseudoflavonifractor phocaeensis]
MAYTKIITIRKRLDHCINYALNKEKDTLDRAMDYISDSEKNTEPGEYGGVTCFETALNCGLETACMDMMATKRHYDKPGRVLAYHIIQSFAPGEVTPQQAHAIGVEFARRLLADRYEVVVSTHLNKDHIHSHILFNSVSYADGRKYRNQFKNYYEGIRGVSDQICREQGLSVIEPVGRGKQYAQWDAEQKGRPTFYSMTLQDVEAALAESNTMQEFVLALKRRGYQVKCGPRVAHMAVRPPGASKNIRLDHKSIGYPEERIRAILEANRRGEKIPAPEPPPPCKVFHVPSTVRCYKFTPARPRPRYSKAKGLRGMYLQYLYLLYRLGKGKPPPRAAFLPREEVIKYKRYQAQAKLLCEYRIDTTQQLTMLAEALQAQIDMLCAQRKVYYKLRRRGRAPEAVNAEIDRLTTELRPLRRKLKLCGQINNDIPRILMLQAAPPEGRKRKEKEHVQATGHRNAGRNPGGKRVPPENERSKR